MFCISGLGKGGGGGGFNAETHSNATETQISLYFFFISASWQEAASMVFLFSKIANFVLFARSDLRLGLIYLIICLGK